MKSFVHKNSGLVAAVTADVMGSMPRSATRRANIRVAAPASRAPAASKVKQVSQQTVKLQALSGNPGLLPGQVTHYGYGSRKQITRALTTLKRSFAGNGLLPRISARELAYDDYRLTQKSRQEQVANTDITGVTVTLCPGQFDYAFSSAFAIGC